MKTLLLIHFVTTIMMFGIIAVVQFVHYPLFARVGDAQFEAYQSGHMNRISFVVEIPMLLELGSGIGLVWLMPWFLSPQLAWTGLALLAIIWISTFALQVPQHRALTNGFEAELHRRLVRSNWIRTICWGARSVIVVMMIVPLIRL